MTLDEVRILLNFRDRPDEDCQGVNRLLDKHIDHVVRRIESLSTLEAQLRHLRHQCVVTDASKECGILHALSEPANLELTGCNSECDSGLESVGSAEGPRPDLFRGKADLT